MAFLSGFAALALVILVLMALMWVISLALKNSSIVDIFWGMGFVIVTWLALLMDYAGAAPRKLLLALLVTVWGLRLSLHILARNWGKPEDFRYQAWRRAAGGSWWWRSFFKVFLLQGIILWIVAAPLIAVQTGAGPRQLIWVDCLAVLVWLKGFFFEAVGDWQLARFKADPANKAKVLQSGVWRYTRHPNYFGDATQWWGFYLVALAAGFWWTIFSPVLMTLLLLRVSGVTMMEKSLAQAKPGYKEYIESTNEFIPWLPKKRG